VVPNDHIAAVVVSGFAQIARMVPAMIERAAEEIVQRSETHVEVAVLEATDHPAHHEAKRQRFGWNAEQQQRYVLDASGD